MKPESTSPSEHLNIMSGVVIAVLMVILVALAVAWPKPVQAKSVAIPTQLDLGGIMFKVDVIDAPGGTTGFIGYTRCDTHHIELNRSAHDLRETLGHELLHAYVCEGVDKDFSVENFYYNSKTENGHEGLDKISYVYVDALERNPSLAAYLAGDGK